jgi:hypothetical protein
MSVFQKGWVGECAGVDGVLGQLVAYIRGTKTIS